MKTTELTGAALDWAASIAEGFKPKQLYICSWSKSIYTRTFNDDGEPVGYMTGPDRLYSRKWEAGGPIIERERICIEIGHDGVWLAYSIQNYDDDKQFMQSGSAPLEAAMRCYVASKLGDNVEIPEELI